MGTMEPKNLHGNHCKILIYVIIAGFHFQIFGWGGNFPRPQGGEFPPPQGGENSHMGGESSARNSRHFAKVISNKANNNLP